jgi:hypothetical protein
MTELSLPERLVSAAEKAIEEVSVTVFRGITGVESVEGYPADLAKAALSAAFEEWAVLLDENGYWLAAYEKREQAQAVRDVPALEV